METSLYDTNVLIEHLRNETIEITGFTTILNLIEFPKAVTFKGLDIIIPGKEDYDKAFEMSLLLLKAGKPIPAVDIILAAIATNRDLTLYTHDRHFKYVQEINKDFRMHLFQKRNEE